MTKRIAIAILLTVWLVLLLAGGLAYGITRSLLLADLDATLLSRLVSLPDVERPSSFSRITTAATDVRDRFVIHNPEGKIIARPATSAPTDVPPPEILAKSFTSLADGSRLRTLTVKAFAHRASPADPLVPVTIVYSGPADRFDALLSRLLMSLGAFGLLAGLATAAVAVAVARTALKPLRHTAEAIGTINEKNLDRRIPLDRLPPELLPVAHRLNDLLARLETAFAQRQQFLADASHELRTPVAAMITTLEVTLNKSRNSADYIRALESCLADARLLHLLVASLLDQVRDEQFAAAPCDLAPVRLTAVLEHCASIVDALAQPKNIRLERRLPSQLLALTDELKIHSIATNLLSNAVDYTPPGGQITLALEILPLPPNAHPPTPSTPLPDGLSSASRLLRLTVTDNGHGIAPEHIPHLFEPFYRVDKARSNNDNHLGLGLFLVRSHARRLGGDCQVDSSLRGTRFTVDIPTPILTSENTPSPGTPRPQSAQFICNK